MRLIVLAFVLTLFAAWPQPGIAADEASALTKSYKATTADECIHENECVWHHFLLALQPEVVSREIIFEE